jgi:hypothetical protein
MASSTTDSHRILGAYCSGGHATLFRDHHSRTWRRTSERSWLPKAASDVSFARTCNWQYYEFDISEPEFVRWASRWELSEIDEPFFVTRFSVLDSPGALYDGPRDVLERRSGSLIPENLPGYTAQITEGLCYHHYDEKRHGGVYVAFDRGTSRAYFHSAAR